MCAVWTLTKEQRQVHFDSRMGLFPSFLKHVFIYSIILIENSIKFIHGTNDKTMLLVGTLFAVLLIDISQVYYSSKFK